MKAHVDIHRMLAIYQSLDDVQRRVVDDHVGFCRACADVSIAYQAMDQQIAGLEDSPLSPTLAAEWSEVVRAERRLRDSSLWAMPSLTPRVVLPVLLLLILACGLWLLMHLWTPSSPGISETPSVTPSTTPVVQGSRPSDVVVMVSDALRHPAAMKPGSEIFSGSTGRAIAPTTQTPAPLASADPSTTPAYP